MRSGDWPAACHIGRSAALPANHHCAVALLPLPREEFRQLKLILHSELRRRAASRRALPCPSSLFMHSTNSGERESRPLFEEQGTFDPVFICTDLSALTDSWLFMHSTCIMAARQSTFTVRSLQLQGESEKSSSPRFSGIFFKADGNLLPKFYLTITRFYLRWITKFCSITSNCDEVMPH